MNRSRLDGWKTIGAYVNRSARQCQRLAVSSGLPVHKLPSSRAVYAFSDELDAWLTGNPNQDGTFSDEVSAHLTSSGRHVVIPVTTFETTRETDGRGSATDLTRMSTSQAEGHMDDSKERLGLHFSLKRVALTVASAIVVVVALAWGIHFRHETAWRALGTPLTGAWTFANGGVAGKAQNVGRFDTGSMIGPGCSMAVTLTSGGTRWAGGLEIFEDDLHWTFVAISPREHEIDVERFPAGTVNRFFAGSTVSPGKQVRLTIILAKDTMNILSGRIPVGTIRRRPWDVGCGRLVLRVGSPGDELHPASGGNTLFAALQVSGALTSLPPTTVAEVPRRLRPSATYTLIADNIDDQLDVLLDGKRLATASYREKIGPLVIDRFLSRGEHTLSMRLFNRKWSAAYGIRLEENGVDIWNERCGNVRANHADCNALKTRLGMVKQLHVTFRAH